MNTKDVVNAILDDYKSFFNPPPEINLEFSAPMGPVALKNKIRMPKFSDEIELDDNKLYFTLLTVCHELAHLTHAHLDYTSEEDEVDEDSIAIELWADGFASKLAMCIMTFGKFKTFIEKHNLDERLKGVIDAVIELAETYHRDGGRSHPEQVFRTRSCVAGITSFLTKLHNTTPDAPEVIHILHVARRSTRLFEIYGDEAKSKEDLNKFEIILRRIQKIHLKIQGNKYEIAENMNPEIANYLDTSFIKPRR